MDEEYTLDFIISQIKEEIEFSKSALNERINCKDFGGALRREGEIDGLMKAYQIASYMRNSAEEMYNKQ